MTPLAGTLVPEGQIAPDTQRRIHGVRFHLAGLPWDFWALQAYLFIGLAAIDEEWRAVAQLRPRLILGTLLLVSLVQKAMGAAAKAPDSFWKEKSTRWLLAFIASGFLAAFWSFAPSLSWPATIEQTTRMIGFILIVGTVRTRRAFIITLLVFAAGHGAYLLRSYMEYLNGRHDFQMGVKRMLGAGSAYADANSFGATVVFAMPLVVWVGIHVRHWFVRLGVLAYSALGAVSVILTHSRGGFVILLLTGLWAVAAIPKASAKLALAGSLVVLGVLLASGLTETASKRYAGIFETDTYEYEPSAAGRIWGYKVAWMAFENYPILGVGPGAFPEYKMKYVDGRANDPHNLAGELIATRGVVGTVAFFGYVAAVLAFARRERKRRGGPTASPWDRSVRSFVGTMAFVMFLLVVSGLGAHNLARSSWYWSPGLMLVAARCRPEPGDDDVAAPNGPRVEG